MSRPLSRIHRFHRIRNLLLDRLNGDHIVWFVSLVYHSSLPGDEGHNYFQITFRSTRQVFYFIEKENVSLYILSRGAYQDGIIDPLNIWSSGEHLWASGEHLDTIVGEIIRELSVCRSNNTSELSVCRSNNTSELEEEFFSRGR